MTVTASNAATQTVTVQASATSLANGRAVNNNGAGNNNNAAGNNNNAAGNNSNTAAGNNSNNAAGNNNNAAGNNNAGGLQSSLQLDPSTIGPGLAQTGIGANGSEAGEVASLTSTNNFINFCSGKQITNGQQVVSGSCNPVPMGDIPAKTNMVSSKFSQPGT